MKKDREKNKNLKKIVEAIVYETIREAEEVPTSIFTKVFIEPFTDVVKTARAGLEKNLATVVGNTRKVAKQFALSMLPFISSNTAKRIGKEEDERLKKRLDQIDSKYADVLRRNIDTLRTRDIAGVGFLLNPQIYVGASAAANSIETAAGLLEIFTDGIPAVTKFRETLEKLNKKVLPPVSPGAGMFGYAGSPDYAGGMGGGGDFGEAAHSDKLVLKEQPGFTKKDINDKALEVYEQLIQRKDVQRALQNSELLKSLREEAIDSVIDNAKEVANLKTYEDFKNYLGSEFNTHEQKLLADLPEEADEETIEKLKGDMVPEFRSSYKQIYTQYLADMAQQTPEASKDVKKAMGEIDRLLG